MSFSIHLLPNMFETSGDVLNIAIAISIAFVAFFLSFALFYITLVVRDLNQITRKARSIADDIDRYIKSPAKAAIALTEKLKLLTHLLDRHNRKKREREEVDE